MWFSVLQSSVAVALCRRTASHAIPAGTQLSFHAHKGRLLVHRPICSGALGHKPLNPAAKSLVHISVKGWMQNLDSTRRCGKTKYFLWILQWTIPVWGRMTKVRTRYIRRADLPSPRCQLALLPLAIVHPLLRHLVLHSKEGDQKAPRPAWLAHQSAGMLRKLQRDTSGYVSVRLTLRGTAQSSTITKSSKSYPPHGK